MDKYYYWLDNVPGIGRITAGKLAARLTPKELYEKGLAEGRGAAPSLTAKQREALEERRRHWDADREWEKLNQKGIRFAVRENPAYPERLKTISDPPFAVYLKGKVTVLAQPAVAVVGARDCSAYGSLAAKELGRELAAQGIAVISGMARGIDGISQWAALEAGGGSVAVLGCGVEVCYPAQNRPLYERLCLEGCLISEYPPWQEAKPGLFPQRNRLISGLADAVVVIEAREKSGTLITVDMALEQGKEVYAMPGRITDALSRGCNSLLKQGAGVFLSPREFAREMGSLWRKGEGMDERKTNRISLTQQEDYLFGLLEPLPLSVEEIWRKGKRSEPALTLSQVMEGLLALVMKGAAGSHEYYFYSAWK